MTTKIQNIERELPVQLTDDELLAKGHRVAEIEAEVKRLEDQRRDRINRPLRALRDERKTICKSIETGEETRAVKCELRWDYTHQVKRTIRLDTNEEVEAESMTAEELAETQTEIPGAEAN